MPERQAPRIYSIPAHRGFADALVAGLVPRYAEDDLGLARLTLLLPSRRTVRTVTEAFVRHAGEEGAVEGLLLPRMAVVGDLDLDEALGPLLDPLGTADIAPAADPVRRWLRLAHYLREVEGDGAGKGAALLRRAWELGRTMDRLLVEGIAPIDLMSDRVIGLVHEHARHWTDNTDTFLKVQQYWIAECAERGEIDAPERRNALFDHAARRWQESPPAHGFVAAGITSASPALARLLRVVSEVPGGSVVLPDLDLTLDDGVWEELGTAGNPASRDDPPFGPYDAVTHPQYHLKLLLNRMGLARGEVQQWHRAGIGAAPPQRSRAISDLFLPREASASWVSLGAERRRLSGVRLMEAAEPNEEAQAIAILVREALEVPERRVAVVTPDRGLAGRVVAHLERWGIEADDSAGQPLSQSPAGRLFLLLAEVLAERAAPVPLVALLTHPLAGAGEGRAQWLDNARKLDLALRGPRPGAGLEPVRELAGRKRLEEWWQGVEAILAPLFAFGPNAPLGEMLGQLVTAAETLCGQALWSGADGRSLSAFVEELGDAAQVAGTWLDPRELHASLRDAMDRGSVRQPWGGHPRVAIYGLLEARMGRADLVICGGLVEGAWPAAPAQDSLLPPAVLRGLGVPGADFRIGLAAHDLAAALGAPEVVLSWALRDDGGPVIPSRFVLRVQAMLGDQLERHREKDALRLAREIDDAPPVAPHPRPQPMPDEEQRKVDISVTGLDRLRGDPYQFYAASILRLRKLEGLDGEASAAWRGEVAHRILELWHAEKEAPARLFPIAKQVLDEANTHPLMRALWWPRLAAALETFSGLVAQMKLDGRRVAACEAKGEMHYRGIRVHGRADRIDRLESGKLAVVDYKTGGPPRPAQVKEGFALQLGLLAMMAQRGGFRDIAGESERFEYWSLAKAQKTGTFGYVTEPVTDDQKKAEKMVLRDEFLFETERYLNDALDKWILGTEPFTARLNPQLANYADYDQLMRLDEWITRMGRDTAERERP